MWTIAIFRVDKKFCSDQCLNAYNNKQKRTDNNYIRNVNNILRKNHRVLAGLLKGEKASAKKEKLLSLGFSFEYYINTYQTKYGRMYYYCCDIGYINTTTINRYEEKRIGLSLGFLKNYFRVIF